MTQRRPFWTDPDFWRTGISAPFTGLVIGAGGLAVVHLTGRLIGFDAFSLSFPLFLAFVLVPMCFVAIRLGPYLERHFGIDDPRSASFGAKFLYVAAGWVTMTLSLITLMAL